MNLVNPDVTRCSMEHYDAGFEGNGGLANFGKISRCLESILLMEDGAPVEYGESPPLFAKFYVGQVGSRISEPSIVGKYPMFFVRQLHCWVLAVSS